ncbi:Plant self-incompatibility protein S1 family [Euphorbia peplus]|nr:Plant self-incompatibility protein S1 family [Euphorbia peplus]
MRALRSYLLLFMALAVAMADSSLCTPLTRYHVHIINNLEGNEVLRVSCKSKQDYLGLHKLKANKQFSFSFKENFWRTTLYWCNFNWTDKNGNHHHTNKKIWWDEMNEGGIPLISRSGKNCIWSARHDGLYLLDNRENQYGKVYLWEHL